MPIITGNIFIVILESYVDISIKIVIFLFKQ